MGTLALEYSQLLQGTFSLGKRNLLFVFQVNCPGCFFYGFPMMDVLFKTYRDQLGFLGLSTAFEDFDLNTLKNTELLLNEKKLVGETKKAFSREGEDTYPYPIDFPIAMDVLHENSTFITQENIERVGLHFKKYQEASNDEQQQFQNEIKAYLKAIDLISVTFTLNQFRGTPTFVLFDDTFNILEHWFGHQLFEEVEKKIVKWLN